MVALLDSNIEFGRVITGRGLMDRSRADEFCPRRSSSASQGAWKLVLASSSFFLANSPSSFSSPLLLWKRAFHHPFLFRKQTNCSTNYFRPIEIVFESILNVDIDFVKQS